MPAPEDNPQVASALAGGTNVLVVMAHPDDVDFSTAGSVALWRAQGAQVTYVLCTDGDAGGSDRDLPRAEMAAIRRREQTAAAAAVGVDDLVFLGHGDGRLAPTLELRRDLSRVIRQRRPQLVVCQSPERNWDRVYASHPDHLAAGEAAMCAVYPDARNPFAHPELLDAEGLEPHTVEELWVVGHSVANRVNDVTDFFEQKLAALRCHRSQVGDGEQLEPMLRDWMGANAASAGLAPGRLAEAFRAVDTR